MSKIRKLYYFDKKKTQEMISFLNNNVNDNYITHIMFNPFMPLHHLLPLKLKFLPESYVLIEDNDIKGLITIAPTKLQERRMEIQKLFFEENSLSIASDLIQYVVSKYKAMGVASIMVKVDDYFSELVAMLINKCGFSQISNEKLWRINKVIEEPFNEKMFRQFRNSDANKIESIYNDCLLPHFRPFLSKEAKEFKEVFCKGLLYYSEYKYTIENLDNNEIIGCINIQTSDNENFIIEIIYNNWMGINLNSIIYYAVSQIRKRKKRFGLFIKTKNYANDGKIQEELFEQNGFECVQNQIVLTNSSAKILKENMKAHKYTVITDFISNNPIPNQ